MVIAEKIEDQVALVLSLEEAILLRHIYASIGIDGTAEREPIDNMLTALSRADVDYVADEDTESWLDWHNKYILGSITLKKGTVESIRKSLEKKESEDEDIPF